VDRYSIYKEEATVKTGIKKYKMTSKNCSFIYISLIIYIYLSEKNLLTKKGFFCRFWEKIKDKILFINTNYLIYIIYLYKKPSENFPIYF